MRPRPWMLVILFVADRYLKHVLWFTPPRGGVSRFLHPVLNRDIAFSLPVPSAWSNLLPVILLVISGMIIGYGLVLWSRHERNWFWWGVIGIGAVSNVLDRFVLGGVLDYLDLGFWPIFNMSDTFITIGVVALLIPMLRRPRT